MNKPIVMMEVMETKDFLLGQKNCLEYLLGVASKDGSEVWRALISEIWAKVNVKLKAIDDAETALQA